MKIVLAQLKKDATAAKRYVWIWAICVAFDTLCAVGAKTLHYSGSDGKEAGLKVLATAFIAIIAGAVASYLAQLALMATLIVRVVHADPLIEPDAFWRTRPIPRGALLLEKALFVTVLAVGTIGSSFAFNVRAEGLSAVNSLLSAIVLISGLFAFSAVTSNLTKLILTYVGFAFGAQFVVGIVSFLIALAYGYDGVHFQLPWRGWLGPTAISTLYLAGFTAVIISQYITLKTNVSYTVLGLTFLLTTALRVH